MVCSNGQFGIVPLRSVQAWRSVLLLNLGGVELQSGFRSCRNSRHECLLNDHALLTTLRVGLAPSRGTDDDDEHDDEGRGPCSSPSSAAPGSVRDSRTEYSCSVSWVTARLSSSRIAHQEESGSGAKLCHPRPPHLKILPVQESQRYSTVRMLQQARSESTGHSLLSEVPW